MTFTFLPKSLLRRDFNLLIILGLKILRSFRSTFEPRSNSYDRFFGAEFTVLCFSQIPVL